MQKRGKKKNQKTYWNQYGKVGAKESCRPGSHSTQNKAYNKKAPSTTNKKKKKGGLHSNLSPNRQKKHKRWGQDVEEYKRLKEGNWTLMGTLSAKGKGGTRWQRTEGAPPYRKGLFKIQIQLRPWGVKSGMSLVPKEKERCLGGD